MQHLRPDQLGKLREGALSGAELLAADDHLAICEQCRAQVAALSPAVTGWSELAGGMRAAAAVAGDHLSYQLLHSYVDGTCPDEERIRLESHLAECESCRKEAADLKAFAAAFQARNTGLAPYKRYLIWGPIAATLLIGALLMRPHVQPAALAVSLQDGGKTFGLDSQGRLVGAGAAGGAAPGLLLTALREGRIAVAIPDGLRTSRSVLLGADADEKPFRVLSPVGEPVLQDTVEFHWEALKGATTYQVQVFDTNYQPQASSPKVEGTSWTLVKSLERGKVYVWQVAALRNGIPVKAPQPPDPEARFLVVAAAESGAIEQARQAQAGHLEMAALYAQAGLCRQAVAEMDALDRENRSSALVQRIRASVAGQCDAGMQH